MTYSKNRYTPPPFLKISSKGIGIATSKHGCFEHGCSITSKLRTECFPVFMHKAWTTTQSQNTSLGAGETVVSKHTHVLDTVGRLEPHLEGWTIEEKTWTQVEGETQLKRHGWKVIREHLSILAFLDAYSCRDSRERAYSSGHIPKCLGNTQHSTGLPTSVPLKFPTSFPIKS